MAASARTGAIPAPPPAARRLRTIALLMEQDAGYHGGVIRGVTAYAKTRADWVFHLSSPTYADVIDVARDLRPGGIVLNVLDPAWVRPLRRLKIPVVNVGCDEPNVTLPRVGVDDLLAGRMAAEHLVERGFHRFGFYGQLDIGYSRQRREGFTQALRARGYAAATFDADPAVHRLPQQRELRWVAELPKPIAVFACSDQYGLVLAEACRQAQVAIPEELAILAMDNNELICPLAYRPLSTVINPSEQIGFEAAALLDRLMSGSAEPAEPRLVAPPGIVTRHSTDVLAVDDPAVAEAVRFIHERADEPIGVEDVLAVVAFSRRSLERRFIKHLGRTPLAEIRRVHLERAREMLARSDLPIEAIAQRCGLRTASNLSTIFRKSLGITPSDFRRRHRRAQSRTSAPPHNGDARAGLSAAGEIIAPRASAAAGQNGS